MEIKLKDIEIHHNLFIKEIEPLFMIQMFHNYQLKILKIKHILIIQQEVLDLINSIESLVKDIIHREVENQFH